MSVGCSYEFCCFGWAGTAGVGGLAWLECAVLLSSGCPVLLGPLDRCLSGHVGELSVGQADPVLEQVEQISRDGFNRFWECTSVGWDTRLHALPEFIGTGLELVAQDVRPECSTVAGAIRGS